MAVSNLHVSPTAHDTPSQLQTPLVSQRTPAVEPAETQWRLLPLQLQRPFTHDLPFEQALLQPPQFRLSLVTVVSQPSSVPVLGWLQFALPG